MHRCAVERLVEIERRKNARQPPRHHRLAATGRADQQNVVAAGRGDFQRALRHALADHVGEIGFGIAWTADGAVMAAVDAGWCPLQRIFDRARR